MVMRPIMKFLYAIQPFSERARAFGAEIEWAIGVRVPSLLGPSPILRPIRGSLTGMIHAALFTATVARYDVFPCLAHSFFSGFFGSTALAASSMASSPPLVRTPISLSMSSLVIWVVDILCVI